MVIGLCSILSTMAVAVPAGMFLLIAGT